MAKRHGYALLPTAGNPTSHMTFRLSPEEVAERNQWIMDAHILGHSTELIAQEVGLSAGHVSNILKYGMRNQGEKTIADVFNTMNEDQKKVVYYLVGRALESREDA